MRYTSAADWSAHYDRGRSFRALSDIERELLATHIPATPGAVALEIGCGRGELARHLATTGWRVVAVDYAHGAIAAARAETDPVPGDVLTFAHFDIDQDNLDELPHARYDLVIFRLSYAFVQNRTLVTARLRERLRSDGAFCVITPLADAVPRSKRFIALDETEIRQLCTGWGSVERHDANGLAFVVLREDKVAPSSGHTKPSSTER